MPGTGSGKRLSVDHRAILERLFQIEKLKNHEIAWILDCDERTIRRRRNQFKDTGSITTNRDVSKNAEKLKPHHLEKLRAWLEDRNEETLLQEMQNYLKEECGIEISISTISRQLKRVTGGGRWKAGRSQQLKANEGGDAGAGSRAMPAAPSSLLASVSAPPPSQSSVMEPVFRPAADGEA